MSELVKLTRDGDVGVVTIELSELTTVDVTGAPFAVWNGTFIERSFPRRSLRVWKAST